MEVGREFCRLRLPFQVQLAPVSTWIVYRSIRLEEFNGSLMRSENAEGAIWNEHGAKGSQELVGLQFLCNYEGISEMKGLREGISFKKEAFLSSR